MAIKGRKADNSSGRQSKRGGEPSVEASPVPAADYENPSGDPDFMMSLARGLCVLQAFARHKRSVTVSQLSSQTGLSRAAVRRCLYTLTRLGYTGCDDSGHNFLLPKVMALGYAYFSSMPFVRVAQPVLDRLANVLGESCSIAVLQGHEIVYVVRTPVTRIMSVDLQVGSRLPAFCTSMGRVLLANLPGDECEMRLAQLKIHQYTGRTVATVDRLRRILKAVQRSGFSIADQELEIGLRSIAVPVRNASGKVVAALNSATHAARVSRAELHVTFLPHLLKSAEELGMLAS
jgi:IclR family pca regulon transcriptional regulator